ncbi:flagellar P-ring protein precursor FlgI [Dyella sp. SG562]|uniref:flagellar basal body P-ring protein FlgI n=1 Tax=Dyella sp. SG562 TaxID=2587017 RepID=UPI001420A883|nr:flagellar basal body P-ring protein FlgI [Dyella sp. SG562]NII74885.1 flagellar P-ring protein precursor FlgI [Dyella sp. SG562]
MRRGLCAVLLAVAAFAASAQTQTFVGVRLKEIARAEGVQDNALIGYGLVVGLAGSGDTNRNHATLQSVANTLSHFGVNVSTDDLNSRNVAAVMVTATLPAFAESGQKLDVSVASVGDARSLGGGTLLLTPLDGPDGQVYALAQGAISVGGYKVQSHGNLEQKNHPTAGLVPEGATVQRSAPLGALGPGGTINLILYQPDFTTASRVAQAVQRTLPGVEASAAHAGKVVVHFSQAGSAVQNIAALENVMVQPDQVARVVVNERTGTVVSGGDVQLASVTISQGDLRVSIKTDYLVSQPGDGVFVDPSRNIRTAIVPQTKIKVNEDDARMVQLPTGATVGDLISALRAIHLSTRDVITVLQSIKAAGALRGELLIQ